MNGKKLQAAGMQEVLNESTVQPGCKVNNVIQQKLTLQAG